jgi:hypothetical protein
VDRDARPDSQEADGCCHAEEAKTGRSRVGDCQIESDIFFLFVAIGLFTSTLTGIYMSYRYGGSKLVVTLLLLAGIVIPLVAMPF